MLGLRKRTKRVAVCVGGLLFLLGAAPSPAKTKRERGPTKERCREVLVTYAALRSASAGCSGIISETWQRRFASEKPGADISIRDCTAAFGKAFLKDQLEEGEQAFSVDVDKNGRKAACERASAVLE